MLGILAQRSPRLLSGALVAFLLGIGESRSLGQEPMDDGLDLLLESPSRGAEEPAGTKEESEAHEAPENDLASTRPDGDGSSVFRNPALPRSIEEIVVTARKTEENLQEVPVTITVMDQEALSGSSVFEMMDLQSVVPNLVTAAPLGAQMTALTFQIRGQVQNDIIGTLDPSVGFYEDGVYVARPDGANVSFFDVRSVQVLRGPQGTLFGRNTTGGAVLLETHDPDMAAFSGTARASLGTFGRKSFDGVLNLPLLEDRLSLRLAGRTLSLDGFAFDETNRRDLGEEHEELLRIKLLYRPAPTLRLLLTGQSVDVEQSWVSAKPVFALKPSQAQTPGTPCCLAFLNSRAQGVEFEDFIGGNPDRASFDPDLRPLNRLGVRSLALDAGWDRSWGTIRLIAGVRENAPVVNRLDGDGTPSTIIDTLQTRSARQHSYEMQLTGSWWSERLRWVAGGVYFDESVEERQSTSALVPLATTMNPIRTLGDVENRSAGGYAQATWSMTSRWRVTGGVRYSWDDKRMQLSAFQGRNCAVPEEVRDVATRCEGTFDADFGNVSYLVGTDYRLLDDVTAVDDLFLYGSATTGYRSGGQNLRGTSVETLQPFRPETLMQFEVGFKSDLLDRRVRLNGAGFHTLYDDIQRSVVRPSNSVLPATVTTNAASAEVTGAELELSALPIDGLQLGASFGLTLPRYHEFVDVTGDRSDEKWDFVPKRSFALSMGVENRVLGMPWSNHLDWSWKDEIPHAQGNLRYFRERGIDIEGLVNEPPTGILNVRSVLGFRDVIEIGVFARNVTNERRFTALSLDRGPDFAAKYVWDRGREIGFDVSCHF